MPIIRRPPKKITTMSQKCTKCKKIKLLSFFKVRVRKKRRVVLKTCIECSEKFKCTYENCDFMCSTNSDLQQHLKAVHKGIRNFKCTYENCDYTCSKNTNLTRHIKNVHEGIKDFKCPYEKCDYECNDSAHLQEHIDAVHKGIRDFKCPYANCDYASYYNRHLQQHVKAIHKRIKDFKCPKPDCNFMSSYNEVLQRHIEICTGSRTISRGEFKIIQCLEELGFYEDEDYRYNSPLPELTKYCKKYLRFDFMFINHKRVFEYDGEQHEMPVRFGGISQEEAEEKFQKTKENDKLKDDFCRENGYKMVRISYKDYPNILSILHCELMDIMDNVG